MMLSLFCFYFFNLIPLYFFYSFNYLCTHIKQINNIN